MKGKMRGKGKDESKMKENHHTECWGEPFTKEKEVKTEREKMVEREKCGWGER